MKIANPAKVLIGLALLAAAGGLTWKLTRARGGAADGEARASLAIVRVDDGIDPFAGLADAGAGLTIDEEPVPIGKGSTVVHFARSDIRPGENTDAALARVRESLRAISLPAGARFGAGLVTIYDADGRGTDSAVRSYVLSGEPIATTEDVARVAVIGAATEGDTTPAVMVTLDDTAAKRLEGAADAWMRRRLAIVVNDEVRSAPILRTPIRGGKLSIGAHSGPGGDEEIRRLAQALRAR